MTIIEEKTIYSCENHIEQALDDFVNSEEVAPRMIKIPENSNIKCSYCEKSSEYELLK